MVAQEREARCDKLAVFSQFEQGIRVIGNDMSLGQALVAHPAHGHTKLFERIVWVRVLGMGESGVLDHEHSLADGPGAIVVEEGAGPAMTYESSTSRLWLWIGKLQSGCGAT